jgi:hypothetical protein
MLSGWGRLGLGRRVGSMGQVRAWQAGRQSRQGRQGLGSQAHMS